MSQALNIFGRFLAMNAAAMVVAGAPALGHPTIDVAASNWQFTPATITIPIGEPTTLRLTSTGGVHGIQSKDLGIPATTIAPGTFITVTFTPKKAGTYKVNCSIFCGAGHPNMALTIVVK